MWTQAFGREQVEPDVLGGRRLDGLESERHAEQARHEEEAEHDERQSRRASRSPRPPRGTAACDRPVKSYLVVSQRRAAIISSPGCASRGQVSEHPPQ